MKKADIIRAWKDPEFRATLSGEELASLPAHPAGLVELDDEELARAAGLYGYPQTTNLACTMSTFRKHFGCCST